RAPRLPIQWRRKSSDVHFEGVGLGKPCAVGDVEPVAAADRNAAPGGIAGDTVLVGGQTEKPAMHSADANAIERAVDADVVVEAGDVEVDDASDRVLPHVDAGHG